MSYNKNLISNLVNDEMRNMFNNNTTNNNTNKNITNDNINNYNNLHQQEEQSLNIENSSQQFFTRYNTELNQKYKNYLNKPQTIKENLGVVFNDDSIASNSLSRNPNDKISHEGLQNLDIETKYILISSEDRPWFINNGENMFNFKINCGDISLLYDNQISDVDIESSAVIRHSLENIISVRVDNLILTNREMENGLRPTTFPFLQVQIQGIEYTSFGTNKNADLACAFLSSKIPLPNNFNDVKFLEMVNVNKQQKEFYIPKSKMNKLTLSILRHDGQQLLNNDILSSRDVMDVKVIYYDTTSSYLIIETSSYFPPNNFVSNDIIKFRNYEFRETNLAFSECFLFNNFINRNEGHIILNVGKTDDVLNNNNVIYFNKIIIEAPTIVNSSSGIKENESWFQSLLDKTTLESNLESDNTGRFINSSLQIHLLLSIKILNKHSSRLIKNIKMQ